MCVFGKVEACREAYFSKINPGDSYFCNLKEAADKALSGIVEFELIPLLKEYWFDEPVRVKDWTNNLRSAVK